MSSNHREGADYNERPHFIRCRECDGFGFRYEHGEFCSERCWDKYHRAVQTLHDETLKMREAGK